MARNLFYEALAALVPEVEQKLVDEVFPHFLALPEGMRESLRWSSLKYAGQKPAVGKYSPRYIPLRDAIANWRETFNLPDFTVNDALWSMWWWTVDSDYEVGLEDYHLMAKEILPRTYKESSKKFPTITPPKMPVWYPTMESEASYRAKVESLIQDYKKRCVKDLVPVPEKRNMEHFEWLVRFQVQGWAYSKIAREYLGDDMLVRTVQDAVKQTAAEIGLTLRTGGKRGRPKKVS